MQNALIFDHVEDALHACVMALGGAKAVGLRMRPEKRERAGAWVMDCLNPQRAEKFGPDEVLTVFTWAREAGFHDGMRWFAAQAGYMPPLPQEPQAELADLTRQLTAQMAATQKMMARMEQLQALGAPQGLRVAS